MANKNDEIKAVARRLARGDVAVFGDDFALASDAYNLATRPDFLNKRSMLKPSRQAREAFMDAYLNERKKTSRKNMNLQCCGGWQESMASSRVKGYENPAAAINQCRKHLLEANNEKIYRCAISRRGLENGPKDRNDKLWIDAAKHLTQLNGLGSSRKRKGKR